MTPPRRVLAAAVALTVAAVLGGGVAYAATELTQPSSNGGTTMSSSMTGDSMMGGARTSMPGVSMAMGTFSTAQPFDAQFIDQMSVHHRGAIASTQAMIADSTRPEMRALARNIITSQRAQLEQMRTWRAQWYPHLGSTFAMGDGTMGGSMMGNTTGATMMGSDQMMAGAKMTGPGTERMYLQMMIAHHQLAVDMAKKAQQRATHPKLRALAATIAREQSAQIIQMRAYLATTPR